MSKFNTPIIFMVYNRPKETLLTLDRIKSIRPSVLYIVSDYAKNRTDLDKNNLVKNIIDNQIDWPCEIIKDYATEHLGLKYRPSSGISNAFKIFDEAIILEDDCLPDESFFKFCEELLCYYRNNNQIMCICGDQQIQQYSQTISTTYYFSKFMRMWGWATWKRAWEQYDITMSDWPKLNSELLVQSLLKNQTAINYWIKHLEWVYNNELITWDFQWAYTILKNGGRCILPKYNLISNIGFNNYATNTKNPNSSKANKPIKSISFPMIHPKTTEINQTLDNILENIFILGT